MLIEMLGRSVTFLLCHIVNADNRPELKSLDTRMDRKL